MIQYAFDPFPELTTQRLRLRRLELQDQQEIYSLRSDERVNAHLDRDPATSIEDAIVFIGKIDAIINRNEAVYWGICLKENPRLIGTICYFNFSAASDSAEIGYELHPFYQGKGIMQEAMSSVIHYGFEELKLSAITAFPSMNNINSIRLLERHGFKIDDLDPKKEGDFVKYIRRNKPPGFVEIETPTKPPGFK